MDLRIEFSDLGGRSGATSGSLTRYTVVASRGWYRKSTELDPGIGPMEEPPLFRVENECSA